MKKYIAVGLICGAIGFVLGNAFWYLASPLWIDRVVSETLVRTDETQTLATGQFVDADSLHKAAGDVEVVQTGDTSTIRFTNFSGTNGPDLYVWLVKAETVTSSDDVKASEWLDLGVLKGNIGDQNYTIPAGTNINDYGNVVVWCKQFGVLFGTAKLENS